MATPIYYPPLENGLQKTVGSDLSTGVTASVTLNNTNQVQNKPGVIVIDRIDSTGALKDAADREYIAYTGTSGLTLTGLTRGVGNSTDQDHAVGAVVEFVPDVTIFEAMATALATIVDADDVSVINSAIATLTGTQTLTNKTLTAPTVTTGTFATPVVTGASEEWEDEADAATITFDLATGNKQRTTLGDNRTLALSNVQDGHVFILRLLQDGTGSRTVTWWSTIKWADGSAPTLTTTADKADVFGFIQTGTDTYDGFVVGQNI
jgi:hypothetical protein